MIPVMEEIILTCLVLTGTVQISDNVTLVCQPTTELLEDASSEQEDGPSEVRERRSVTPSGGFVPPDPSLWPEHRRRRDPR